MRLGGLIMLVAAGVLATPAHAEDRQVSVGNNAFSPADLTIIQGDAVTWTWTGPDTNHSTTTDSAGQTTWDSDPDITRPPNHPVGDKFSREFSNTGKFSYFCRVHSFMTGTITVQPKPTDPFPAADTVAPQFGTPTVQVKRRRVRFRLDEPAEVEAKLRGPTRKNLTLSANAGTNVLKLPKRLDSGRYALAMRATDEAGNRSLVAKLRFRVP